MLAAPRAACEGLEILDARKREEIDELEKEADEIERSIDTRIENFARSSSS